jgi:hypothetical protein
MPMVTRKVLLVRPGFFADFVEREGYPGRLMAEHLYGGSWVTWTTSVTVDEDVVHSARG